VFSSSRAIHPEHACLRRRTPQPRRGPARPESRRWRRPPRDPTGSMLFTIMAALGQMEDEIKRERVTDSISKRREAEKALAADPAGSLTVRFEAQSAWSKAASPLRRSPAISECPEQRSIDGPEPSQPAGRRLALIRPRHLPLRFTPGLALPPVVPSDV